MLFYLTFFFLLQKLGVGHCDVTLVQPPAIAAMLGYSANLSCRMELNGVKLNRVNLYWLIPAPNNKVKEYLYPKPKRGSARSNNSQLIYPKFRNDLSLTISDVQLQYTDIYICETSLLIGIQNKRSIGKGTYLLVYDEFDTFMNLSDIVCRVKVQAIQNVDLFWENLDQDYANITYSVIPASADSYWIIRVVTNWTQWCQSQKNETFTCQLQYMQQSLVARSTEAPCPVPEGGQEASHAPSHPVLLYVLILINTVVILFCIFVTFLWVKKKRRRNRRVRIVAPYAKFSSNTKT